MKSPLAPTRYTRTAISFHWLIALLVVTMLCIGLYMGGMPLTPAKFQVYQFHKSVGLTILMLASFRLLWRFSNPAPFLPRGTPSWQKLAAQTTHVLLYVMLFAMPLTGWIFSDASGYHPSLFGLPVPVIATVDQQFSHTVEEARKGFGAYLLIGLILAHFGAALYHHLVRRDDILARMLPKGFKVPRPRLPFLVLALILVGAPAYAQVWNINPTASRIAFMAKFNGQAVNGNFKEWYGKIYFDPENLSASDITITIHTASVSSGEMGRDQTLQTPDWFNSKQFPDAVFTTKNIAATGKDTYLVSGSLTLAGVSQPLAFPFKLTIDNGNKARLFASFPLSRSLFGVGKGVWQTNTEIADAVTVTLILNAVKAQ